MTSRVQNQEKAAAIRSSSTTTYHTQPGVSYIDPLQLEQLRQAYENVLGHINSITAGELEQYIKGGIEVPVIVDAIGITARAPRPTFYYLAAILNRYMAQGVRTMDDVREDKRQRDAKRYRAYKDFWADWYRDPEDSMPF